MGKLSKRQFRALYLGEWIEATGYQQSAVAKGAGVSQSYISNLSGGRRANPSAHVLLLISEQIGVTIHDFYLPPPAEDNLMGLRQISAQARESLHLARARTA